MSYLPSQLGVFSRTKVSFLLRLTLLPPQPATEEALEEGGSTN